jgi:hypothetical protein
MTARGPQPIEDLMSVFCVHERPGVPTCLPVTAETRGLEIDAW